MVTVTLGQLVRADGALGRLAQERLPARTAYRVARILRDVTPELELFRERRDALIREHGAEREPTAEETAAGATGPVVAVHAHQLRAFLAAAKALEEVEITLGVDPVPLSDLEAISGADLWALGPLVGDDKP